MSSAEQSQIAAEPGPLSLSSENKSHLQPPSKKKTIKKEAKLHEVEEKVGEQSQPHSRYVFARTCANCSFT